MTDRLQEGAHQWSLRCLALVLGAILVRSSMFHIENNYFFLSTVYSYQMVTPLLGVVLAAVLPYLHLTLGMMLLFFGRTWRIAFACSSAIFVLFTLVQITAHARGLNIACGCFSPSADNPIGFRSITTVTSCAIAAIGGTVLTLRSRCRVTHPTGA